MIKLDKKYIIGSIIIIIAVIVIIVIRVSKKEVLEIIDNSKYVNNIISYQHSIEEDITQTINTNSYSIENPYIKVNPYGISPLTAIVYFSTLTNEKITLTVVGKENNSLKYTFEESKTHIIPIYGLYNNYENKIILETDNGKKYEHKIKIENVLKNRSLPDSLSNMSIEHRYSFEEFNFVSSLETRSSMAYDYLGELRWLLVTGYYKSITKLNNGHILVSSSKSDAKTKGLTDLVEMDLLGKIYNYYSVGNGLHNKYLVLDNGNYLFVSSNSKNNIVGDLIYEINSKTGYIEKEFNVLETIKEIDKNQITDDNVNNWDYNSGLYYDKNSNTLLVSYRGTSTILAFDYNNSRLKWMFGNNKNWSDKFDRYFIKTNNLPSSINNPVLNDNKLTILDNGIDYYELKSPIACNQVSNAISSEKTYEIKINDKIATLISNNNELGLFTFSTFDKTYKTYVFGSVLSEVTNDCELYSYDKYQSIIIEKDKAIKYKGTLSTSIDSLSKFKMYENVNYYIGKGNLLGDFTRNERITSLDPYINKLSKAYIDDEYDVTIEDGIVKVNSVFLEDEYVNVLLVQNDSGFVLKYKEKGVILNNDISIVGLSGKYKVYLDYNEDIIDIDKTLEF